MGKNRDYRRIVDAVLAAEWAIHEPKLEEIKGFLEAKASGVDLTEEEIWASFGARLSSGDGDDPYEPTIEGGVALLEFNGIMSPRMNMLTRFSGGVSTEKFSEKLLALAGNPEVKTVAVKGNTPGGVVAGVEEFGLVVRQLAAVKRVVLVGQSGMIASAGYYGWSGATEMVSTPSTQWGSIGVISAVYETTSQEKMRGEKWRIFRAGRLKGAGNPHEKLTEEMEKALQARVDTPHKMFLSFVAESRGKSVAEVGQKWGEGTLFYAEEALQLGMIDRVANSFADVVAEERERLRGGSRGRAVHPISAKEKAMDTKIIAALHARGLASMDVEEAEAQATLKTFFAARDMKVPEAVEDIVKALMMPAAGQKTGDAGGSNGSNLMSPEEVKRIARQAGAEERARIEGLQATAKLLDNTGEIITAEMIEAASTGEHPLSVAQARDQWVEELAKKDKAIQTGDVRGGGEAGIDRLAEFATEVFCDRLGYRESNERLSDGARQIRHYPLVRIAEIAVQQTGQRTEGMIPEQVAKAFLAIGGTTHAAFAGDIPPHGPGTNPDIMTGFAKKIVDRAMMVSPTTYHIWTARLDDVPNYEPSSILSAGDFGELPMHTDGKPYADGGTLTTELGWFQVDDYGKDETLTPRMILGDKLNVFAQALANRQIGHERTLNRLAINLLASNPNAPDGNPLFDDSGAHDNQLTSGGAPSVPQWMAMVKKHTAMPGIGTTEPAGYEPTIALTSGVYSEEAKQQFLSLPADDVRTINPNDNTQTGDQAINIYRGGVRPVKDVMLNGYSSGLPWYGIVDPMLLTGIGHAFLQGYGPGGVRTTFFDEKTESRVYRIKGSFCVALVHHQAFTNNPGE